MLRWIAILVLVLSLPSCRPTVDCEDTGCSYGQHCSTTTGECESTRFDCRTGDVCADDEVCDTSSGECRSDALRCADGNPCADGLICDGSTGFCRPAFRCSIDGCPTAEICDLQTDRCVAKPCESDNGCPELFVCEEAACTNGCRPNSTTCPPGQACFFQTGDDFGTCSEQCQEDSQCPFGQFCLDTGQGSLCTLEPPCEDTQDCRSDEVCQNTTCAQPPCGLDDDCEELQICDIATGTCIDSSCEEDVFGNPAGDGVPNHSFESAFPLAPQDDCRTTNPPRCFYEDLQICPGRSDWFAITTQSTDIVKIRVEQLTATPDLDIFVYDEDQHLIAQNRQTASVSSVRFASGHDRIVHLEVRGLTNEAASYSLTITNDFCPNDLFEENDDQASATVLATIQNADITGQTCGIDQDWFVLQQLEASQGLNVELESAPPDLEIKLLTPDGDVMPWSREGPLMLSRLGVEGDYYLVATPSLGQSGDYRLNYSVTPSYECPNAELTTTPDTALELQTSPTSGLLCPVDANWETDWLELPAGLAGQLVLDVTWDEGTPSLDVSLHQGESAAPQVVRTGTVSDSSSRIVAPVATSEAYYIRVASNQSLGRILGEPGYQVAWSVTP